ncbi:MAG TPA: LysR family transcriptional regulator [Allosphingosinicella sp.]|nr:LysR family transcriptional regulator [Allosphingosinicella sp.]
MEHSSVDLLDVLAFVRVVETGAFSRAAERMGMSKSIVSRRVARLEEQLRARLLTRSASGAQPTAAGQAYYERASNILCELEAAQEVVAEAVTRIAGPIRLTAPLSFGVEHVAPALAAFAAEHPRVELDISFEDRTVDLIAGGFDLAVRLGTLDDSALIVRRIAPSRRILVGSPAYLATRSGPEHPRDLPAHDHLVYGNEQWRFRVGNRWENVRLKPRLRADNGEMLRAAAEAGLGLCVLPTFIAAPALESGTLLPLLRDFPMPEAALHILMPPGRAVTARVRALSDFLAARFGPEPAWDPCWAQGRTLDGRQGHAKDDPPLPMRTLS